MKNQTVQAVSQTVFDYRIRVSAGSEIVKPTGVVF
jgi:hypothetical protein